MYNTLFNKKNLMCKHVRKFGTIMINPLAHQSTRNALLLFIFPYDACLFEIRYLSIGNR